jgi:NAD(P)-dependent dehydrogenase (short-subunit alcohol dehydrogenase family)
MARSLHSLDGDVALITGGASGIGAAHVRAFAEAGARVAFLDIQDEAASALVEDLRQNGLAAEYLHCDLLDLVALADAVKCVEAQFGSVTCLVNNAAVDDRHKLGEIAVDDFEWMINVNLRHVIFATQAVAPGMRGLGRGSIVNTSSVAWMRGSANLPLYSAAKAAIVGFTNSLARELGPDRVRVNAILPGFVPTPRQLATSMQSPEAIEQARSRQCLPDFVQPEDLANAAVFLCSDAARMITKQCLLINAGSL